MKSSILSLLIALSGPVYADAPLRFGVLAFRPKALITAKWPLVEYLETALEREIEQTVYTYQELSAAVMQNAVDIVLTNPGHYILLRHRNQLSAPLATQITKAGGQELSRFGGVIFTLNESKINSLPDLADKKIAISSIDSLGSYQMEAFELAQAGMPLPGNEQLFVTGAPQDLVAEAVLTGHAGAGFVRTGQLEHMAHEGKLVLERIKVIHRLDWPGFPYLISTSLYPEWPIAVMPQVDEQLARRPAIALLSLSANNIAANALEIGGFTIPADYSSVENLLRQLRMPPFDYAPTFTLVDLWRKYKGWITFLGVFGLMLAGLTVLANG